MSILSFAKPKPSPAKPLVPTIVKDNILTIYLNKKVHPLRSYISAFPNWKGGTIIGPWKDFYQWFFGRTDSEFYILKYKDGELMIRREDIVSFQVTVKEKSTFDLEHDLIPPLS